MNAFRSEPKVGVIILNWNSWQDTLEAVKSVRESDYSKIQIYIVDNASTDQSELKIRSQLALPYEFIQSGKNIGWSGGNNLGITLALEQDCRLVHLINPDVRVSIDTISELVNAVISLPDAAAVGSIVVSYENPSWIEFAGSTLDMELGQLHHISGKKSEIELPANPFKTLSIKGCSLMLTKEGIEKVGMLTVDYFLNYDETDWCYRVHQSNMGLYLVPTSTVAHKGAQSFGGTESPIYRYFITRNRLLFSKRHLKKEDQQFAWRCAVWELKNIIFINPSKYTFFQKIYTSLSVVIAVIDYTLHRYGDCPRIIRFFTAKFNNIKNSR